MDTNDKMFRWKRLWCKLMHNEPMWPVCGHYQCRRCLIRHRVKWTDGAPQETEQRSPLKLRAHA